MNRLLVLKNSAYGAKTGGGVVADLDEVNALAVGAFAIFDDKGVLITAVTAKDGLTNVPFVTFVSGRAKNNQVVSIIPTKGVSVNSANYLLPVKPITTIGGNASNTTLTFTTTGEANVRVYDDSFASNYPIRSKNVSLVKKAGETNEAFVDRVVAALNKHVSGTLDPFFTATKVISGANIGFTIVPKEIQTTLKVATGGMFEGASNVVTTAMVYGRGTSGDILQMEKDFSVEEGNSNYIDYNAEHYSRAMETVDGATYDQINVLWEGRHDTPTASYVAMKNRVVIANPTGSTISTANIVALLTLIFNYVTPPAAG